MLDGASIMYGGTAELRETLEYDFQTEREFSYANLSMSEIIIHLARFISRLWQIHIFGEGNTRTTAVFFIKYIRSLGFHATNDVFAKNAWYFRNALVRAKANITRLYDEFCNDKIFGRGDVMAVLGITERPATALISRMYELHKKVLVSPAP